LANHESKLYSGVKTFLSGKESELKRTSHNLSYFTSNAMNFNNVRVSVLENTLNVLRPENVLKRGFTITSFKGKILKKCIQVKSDDLIDTQFSDGTLRSRVIGES
jgi:exodeoxyribonuclease VII large subunit